MSNGSGTIDGANVTNVNVNCITHTAALTPSVNNLALSVTGLTEYGVSGTPSSGLARIITITNTGSNAAVNLTVTPPTWPMGTTSSTTCGSSLAAGNSCTITVTPGNTATSNGSNPCSNGNAPVPGVIHVTADNASTASINVVVLSYGCIYQGGYVYAFDDTSPNSGNVGGKVATTTDQIAPATGIIWSSIGSGGSSSDVADDIIYGVSEISTTSSPDPSTGQVAGQVACDGSIDGACNTNNIYVYYQNNATNAPINLSYYAAGLCKQTISSFSDWYLPAICELGYGNSPCGTVGAPTLQNMQSNLVDFNSLHLLAGYYWSSNEDSTTPQFNGLAQFFASGGGSFQGFYGKNVQYGVRCSRALTL